MNTFTFCGFDVKAFDSSSEFESFLAQSEKHYSMQKYVEGQGWIEFNRSAHGGTQNLALPSGQLRVVNVKTGKQIGTNFRKTA
jgi:hypothetical protein